MTIQHISVDEIIRLEGVLSFFYNCFFNLSNLCILVYMIHV